MHTPSTTFTIRRATVHDVDALAMLGRRTFTHAFGADNTPENLAAFLDATYSTEHQLHELGDGALTYLVVQRPEGLVAFALLRAGRSSPFVPDTSALELQRFYVEQHCHGTGIAQALMAACLTEAGDRGAATMFLGVWERNARALRFYAAQGFTEVGTQIFRVGSDPQRDRVLSRPIRSPAATPPSADSPITQA